MAQQQQQQEQSANFSEWGGFGDVVFKGRLSPNSISDNRQFNISKQALINGYPKHQNMGEDEHTSTIEMTLNNHFVDITKTIKTLETMAENGVPRALVIGSEVLGQFSIRKLSKSGIETLPNGAVININYQVDVVEVRA